MSAAPKRSAPPPPPAEEHEEGEDGASASELGWGLARCARGQARACWVTKGRADGGEGSEEMEEMYS